MSIVQHPATISAADFDAIRHVDDRGEFWHARELCRVAGYSRWQTFEGAIERAKLAAENSGILDGQFVQVSQPTGAGNLGDQARTDYRLTRYACYLIMINGDPRKLEIAAAQTYFAVKAREAEVAVPAQRRPLVPLDVLRAALDQIEATQQVAEQARAVATDAADEAKLANARLDAIEGRHDCFSALGYAKTHDLRTDTSYLSRLGRLAATIGRSHGIAPVKVQHAHFGLVNEFPVSIWDEAHARLNSAVA